MRRLTFIIPVIFILSFLSGCNRVQNNTLTENKTQYLVSFDSNGGSEIASQYVDVDSKITIPDNPNRTDYSFDGWYIGKQKWDFDNDKVNNNITLKAHWTPTKTHIRIRYNNDLDDDLIIMKEYNEPIDDIETPIRRGYTFKEWSTPIPSNMPNETIIIDAIWDSDVEYFVLGGEASIIGLKHKKKELVILAEYDGIKVGSISSIKQIGYSQKAVQVESVIIEPGIKKIESEAFSNQEMNTIVIPNTVEIIGGYAFRYCNMLTDINIPGSVKTIGNYAFYGCTILKTVKLNEGLESIGDFAFYECESITSINIPDSVVSIGEGFVTPYKLSYNVFDNGSYIGSATNPYIALLKTNNENCESLTVNENCKFILPTSLFNLKNVKSISIPNDIISISGNPFLGLDFVNEYDNGLYVGNKDNPYLILVSAKDKNIISCRINENCKIILKKAFYECSYLKNVITPNSLKSIGNSAFYDCRELNNIVIPDGVEYIGSSAFERCYSLESITIPYSIKTIKNSSFKNCAKLQDVIIQDGVREIELSTFEGCHIKSIKIPNSVYLIGSLAFAYCKQLEEIQLSNNLKKINNLIFYECDSLETAVIPDGVLIIGSQAFYLCASLESITIPKTVEFIEFEAFSKCPLLKTVNINSLESWNNITMSNEIIDGEFDLYVDGEKVTNDIES